MFIKYDGCGDNVIVNLPDSVAWKLLYREFDENGDYDCGLYLNVDSKNIQVRDIEYWCQGRPDLPYYAVGSLYEEIVDVVFNKIENEPSLRVIDIPLIESELLEAKYKQKWIEKGYMSTDDRCI